MPPERIAFCIIIGISLAASRVDSLQGADLNGNGVSDLYERTYGATGILDPNADDDHDGLTNYAEYLLGGNPRRADVARVGGSPEVTALGRFCLRWPTQSGLRYQLEYSADLLSWSPVGSPVVGTGADFIGESPETVVNRPRQFLRLRALPPLDTNSDGIDDWEQSRLSGGLRLVNRYTFNQTSGSTVPDIVSGANATIVGSGITWNGSEAVLPGGPSSSAPYIDFPNGLLSRHAASNSGTGSITIEGWVTVTGAQDWSRLFDFGSSTAGERFTPGGSFSALDSLWVSAMNGTTTTQRRIEWANSDAVGGSGNTFSTIITVANFNQPLHFAVSFNGTSGAFAYYENGVQRDARTTSLRLNNLNDINNWIGRSNYTTDANLQGRFNEFRIYARALTAAEIQASYIGGPTLDPVFDGDADGIASVIEIADPDLDENNPNDADGDLDNDGLTNIQELALGTNMRVSDTDGDGMSDGYEVANGLLPLDSSDQLEDPDGDRVPNIYEFANGTSANNANSTPLAHLVVDASVTADTATTKKTIQAAVNAAPTVTADPNRWTIIEVRPGDYPENVTIDQRRVLLIGKNVAGDLPQITGNSGFGGSFALTLREDGLAVDGIIIKRGGFDQRGVLIVADSTTGRVQLVNCAIRGTQTNNGSFQAAALESQQGIVRIAHCTFRDNVANNWSTNARGIRVSGGSLALENSVLWDTATFGVEMAGGTVRNSIVRGGGISGAIDADPLFESRSLPARDDGLLLSVASPAINAGIVLNVGKRDIHGGPRGTLPDIGIDERNDGDSDLDGLQDEWEYRVFGSLVKNATGDEDTDGLNNGGEFTAGTNPNLSDTDGDGMSDGYEVANSLAPLNGDDQLEDPDGDRVPNIYEFMNGTLANDASSTPAAHLVVDASVTIETATTKKTIQSAVNAAPTVTANPNRWTIIEVRPGDYSENVTIDQRRVFLMGKAVAGQLPVLRGSGAGFALSLLEGCAAADGLLIQLNNGFGQYGVKVDTDATGNRAQLVNCVIRGAATTNAVGQVAALLLERGQMRVVHCIFSDNRANNFSTNVKAISVNAGSLLLQNSIVWDTQDFGLELTGNITAANSIVRGGYTGASALDPRFEKLTSGQFRPWNRLRKDSPAINAGTVIPYSNIDISGSLHEGVPDLGAKEYISTDTDNDGLADEWEMWHFGSLAAAAGGDNDSDGATNLNEFLNYCDPFDSDSDDDGMTDGYELANGLLPVDASDFLLDKDHDHYPNIYEFANGSLANDVGSIPSATITVDGSIPVGAETPTLKRTIQAAVTASPTVSGSPTAWPIIRVLGSHYRESVDLSQHRVLLLGSLSASVPILERAAGASFNIKATEHGTALDGLMIVGAEEIADPNNASTAESAGGVLFDRTTPGEFAISSCILRRHIGDALRAKGCLLRATHNTFVDNYPVLQSVAANGSTPAYYAYQGSALNAYSVTNAPATILLSHSIVWNPVPGESILTDSRADSFRNERAALKLTGASNFTTSNCITRFAELGGAARDPAVTMEGYLKKGSTAINSTAVVAGTLTDIHGELRDASPDIGADEFVDTDNDDLADAWETFWFGNLQKTGMQDSDLPTGDGATNLAEYFAGTNPTLADSDGDAIADLAEITNLINTRSGLIGFLTDSDGDGLSDAFEILSGGNPYDTDTNHDGVSDFIAYQAGISVGSLDPDGDGLDFAGESAKGTSPFLADTDHDGVNDNLDAYPLDPTRTTFPSAIPGDTTPPGIFLDEPANAVPVP